MKNSVTIPFFLLFFLALIGASGVLGDAAGSSAPANGAQLTRETGDRIPRAAGLEAQEDVLLYLPLVAAHSGEDYLLIDGHVRLGDENGPGLAGVAIYRAVAVYEGQVVATTDADGYYKAPPLNTQGHQETIRLWAEKEGYLFEPPEYVWVYYGFGSSLARNFVATANGS